MTGYVLRRLATALLLLYLLLTVAFFVVRLAPGDPAQLLQDARTPVRIQEQLREIWGLDRPLVEQYLDWLGGVVLEWDWGTSFRHQEPVTEIIATTFPRTLLLALTAAFVAYLVGIPLGVVAARRRDGPTDHGIRLASLLAYSLPTFWLGLMAILLFSYMLPLFPASHMSSVGAESLSPLGRILDVAHHLVLPALVLAASLAAGTTRFVRTSLLDVLHQDYLRTARAKGLSEGRVIWVHALRNALLPVIQMFGLLLPAMLNGSLVLEVVFSWPGLGRMAYNAILFRDYPLILAATAFSGGLVVLGNLASDLLHGLTDPRVRDE